MRLSFNILISVLVFIVSFVCIVSLELRLVNWFIDSSDAAVELGRLIGSEEAALIVLLLPPLIIPYIFSRITYTFLARRLLLLFTQMKPTPANRPISGRWESRGTYVKRRFLIAAFVGATTALLLFFFMIILIDIDPATGNALSVLTFIVYPVALPIAAASAALFAFIIVKRRDCNWICRNCAYDLTGNVSGICSECGTKISEEQNSKISK